MGYPAEQNAEKIKTKSTLREYTEALVFALILALIIRTFVVQAFKIPSGSMKTTLLVGDHILVNKLVYGIKMPFTNKDILRFRDPHRGEIVVFRYPMDPNIDFIKRVIGLPGDTVRIQDKRVYVNDKLLDEPYVSHTDPNIMPAGAGPRDNMPALVVPANSLFVMGDNRDESYDSRYWKFVDIGELRGEAIIIYCSWNGGGTFSFDSSKSFIRWNRIGTILK